jgi:thymidylate kinase
MSISHNSATAEFFWDIMEIFKQEDRQLCILHGYTDYPEIISSDIDAIFAHPAEIPQLLIEHHVAKVVQVLQHETTAFSYTLYRKNKDKPILIQLDVSTDYRRNGRIFFRGEEFLTACRPFKFFHVPEIELEFAYYLVKKVAKGELNAAQAQRLSELYDRSPAQCQVQLLRFFPTSETQIIANAAQSQDWELVQSQMPQLRQSMLGKVGREHPLKVCKYWLGDLTRKISRIIYPTGLMVVFLGADGSGKSTVIAKAQENLAPAFRRHQYIHLRPRLGIAVDTDSPPVIDPHAQPPRNWLTSILKLIYFLFDYGVGYAVKIYPQLVRSTLVIFDRYYHDLLVDPLRFRYGGSMWLARLVSSIVPKPDLWILLDAPANILQGRKQEVTFDETLRQREAYLSLIAELPNGHIVDASESIEKVTTQVEEIILDYLSDRTSTRLGFNQK